MEFVKKENYSIVRLFDNQQKNFFFVHLLNNGSNSLVSNRMMVLAK